MDNLKCIICDWSVRYRSKLSSSQVYLQGESLWCKKMNRALHGDSVVIKVEQIFNDMSADNLIQV